MTGLLIFLSFPGLLSAGPLTPLAHAAGGLRIELSVTPDPVIIGGAATYTVTVTNDASAPAADVTATTTLDSNLTAGPLPPGCAAAGQTITCGGAGTSLPAGQALSYQIPVTVDPSLHDGTNLTTRASVSTSTAGIPDASTQLISQSKTSTDVEITKSASPGTVQAGGTITYTLVVTNHGPSDAVDVTAHDPADGNLVSIDSLPRECPPSGLTISCPLGTLRPGQSVTLTITVTAGSSLPDGTVITNCATVYTGTRETDTTNNKSCADTSVGPEPSPSPSSPEPSSTVTLTTAPPTSTAPPATAPPTAVPPTTAPPTPEPSATATRSPSRPSPTPGPAASGSAGPGGQPALPVTGAPVLVMTTAGALLIGGGLILAWPGRIRSRRRDKLR